MGMGGVIEKGVGAGKERDREGGGRGGVRGGRRRGAGWEHVRKGGKLLGGGKGEKERGQRKNSYHHLTS